MGRALKAPSASALIMGVTVWALALASAAADELVVNGDFELGNVGFASDYALSPGWILNQGVYDIVSNPAQSHPSAASYQDHTTGAGLMMAVNGGWGASQAVWSQSMAVSPHTEYRFSIWVSSWTEGSPAVLQFLLNEVPIGSLVAPATAGTWIQYEAYWNSGDNNALSLSIVDLNTVFGGNDFALDDISLTGCSSACFLLVEDFEDQVLDPRISIIPTGTFISPPGIQDRTEFGSAKAFGFGRSTCGASCFDGFVTNFRIALAGPAFVHTISFKEMELYGNWGSKGKIYVDGEVISWGTYNENEDFGRQPTNDSQADTTYRSHSYEINRPATIIDLAVADITNASEIFIDDVVVAGVCSPQSLPQCTVELLADDFESCAPGTWIGACNDWQTWANGGNGADFYVTDAEHISGNNSLHVAGSGTCWEGGAYKYVTAPRHILLQAMMKASGDGPLGCHHYQNGFDIYPATWSFEMAYGDSPGGLVCAIAGGGSTTAISGFANASGRWHSVATELNYDTGLARFWLNGVAIWTTSFDTTQVFNRVWLRSGEGQGWFDDVRVCAVSSTTDVPDLDPPNGTCARAILDRNSPNPFNALTSIRFRLPSPGRVHLAVYDARGRLVRHVATGFFRTGGYRRDWDGRDDQGRAVSSGVYFLRLKTADGVDARRMILLR